MHHRKKNKVKKHRKKLLRLNGRASLLDSQSRRLSEDDLPNGTKHSPLLSRRHILARSVKLEGKFKLSNENCVSRVTTLHSRCHILAPKRNDNYYLSPPHTHSAALSGCHAQLRCHRLDNMRAVTPTARMTVVSPWLTRSGCAGQRQYLTRFKLGLRSPSGHR